MQPTAIMRTSMALPLVALLALGGCGGGPSLPTIPTDGSGTQGGGDWWLPENTRTIVQGAAPTVETHEIPQKLVDTGDNAVTLLHKSGYGRQHDGAFVSVDPSSITIDYGRGGWENRAVVNVNGVSFAERRRRHGTGQEKRIVGFLDYANFSIWLAEIPRPQFGENCCRWAVANDVRRGKSTISRNFYLGTYTWNGAMVGIVKREPSSTILGNARIDLQVDAIEARDSRNTIAVSFTNIKHLKSGADVADMSWQFENVGARGVRGFRVSEVNSAYGDNLVSGSGSVALTWSGPNQENVVGTYENTSYLGAFGGRKQ